MVVKLLAAVLSSTLALGVSAASRPAGDAAPPLALSLVRGGEIVADPLANGALVYLPTGRVLATWDFRNPSAPLRVATTAPVGGVVNGLARHGDHLYATWRGASDSGVAVYSLADPRRPALVWQGPYVEAAHRFAVGVAAANGHLYVFDNNHGVYVSDLANPAQPAFVHLPDLGLPIQYERTVAFGDLIYASGRNFSMQTIFDVYDVGNPMAPQKIASHALDGLNNFSVVPDRRRAVSVGWQFNTWDLGVPGEMTQRSSTEIYGARSAAVIGNRAYSFGFNQGLVAWDIRDLSAPRELGRSRASTLGAHNAASVGTTLLLPTETDLLHAFNVRPAIPGRVSTSWLPGGVAAADAAIHDGRALVVQANYGFTLNDPRTLQPQLRYDAALPEELESRDFTGVDLSGDVAYLTAWGYGLIAVDLSSPKPRELGRLALPMAAVIDVEGRHAYVAKWTNGGEFYVVDVADPTAPALLWQAPLSGQPFRVRVANGHAFMAESHEGGETGGVRVFSLADPAAPVQVARLDDGCGSAFDLSVDAAAARMYLACADGLQVVDISRPAQPVVLGRYASGGSHQFTKVAHRGDRAWFSDDDGLHELDVADPAHPVRIGLTGLGNRSMHRLLPLDDGGLLAVGREVGLHRFAPADAPARHASAARLKR